MSQALNEPINFGEGRADATWTMVRGALVAFFGDEAAKETAKHKNKSLKFKIGDDPQNYVTKKTELIKTIYPRLDEPQVVKKLLKDLPLEFSMSMTMACGMEATVEGFLYHLRRIVEVDERNRKGGLRLNREPPSRPQNFRPQNTSRESHGYSNNGRLSLDQLRGLVDEQGRRLCSLCFQAGHLRRDCPGPQSNSPPLFPLRNPRYIGPQNFNNYNIPNLNPSAPHQSQLPRASYNRVPYQSQPYVSHSPQQNASQQPPRNDAREREFRAMREENAQLRAQLGMTQGTPGSGN